MVGSGTPILKGLALGAGATGTIDFGQMIGYARVTNNGNASVFMAVGAVPPTPSVGDGRVKIMPGYYVELNGIAVQKFSFAMAGTDATNVDAVGKAGA